MVEMFKGSSPKRENRSCLHKKNQNVVIRAIAPYLKYKYLVIMVIPAIIYFIIFRYVPLYGVIIAFKDYSFTKGILGSEWVGLENFKAIFDMPSFWQVFRNTIVISLYKLLVNFPAPILFAIFLNEIGNTYFKKTVQTISYLPHFVSWVVIGGLLTQFLSPSVGPINIILKELGFDPIYFLVDPKWFRTVLVLSLLWKTVGWGSIVYLASITGIDQQLYEAAELDGAGRFRKMFSITLPSLIPVITIMFILQVGKIVEDDFDQIFNLYNPNVYSVGDVIGTYTYRLGLVDMQYSTSTAVGLLKNVISLVLVIGTNAVTKRINDYGIW